MYFRKLILHQKEWRGRLAIKYCSGGDLSSNLHAFRHYTECVPCSLLLSLMSFCFVACLLVAGAVSK